MRSAWSVLSAACACAAVVMGADRAAADPTPAYPQALVDRPIVLLPGMTQVDAALERYSTSTDLLGRTTPYLYAAHAFGPVELDVELGRDAAVHVAFATHAFPEWVQVNAIVGGPHQDKSLFVTQSVETGHRVHVVPHVLSILGAVGLAVHEDRRLDPDTTALVWTRGLGAFAGATVEVQLIDQLALHAGASVGAPVVRTIPDERANLGVGGGLTVTLRTWDFYVDANVGDVTDQRLLSIVVGGTKRFGADDASD